VKKSEKHAVRGLKCDGYKLGAVATSKKFLHTSKLL
jgi:hypothetical protein